jgi:steroid delta-isomerase-like uncharacterized protein
VQTDTNKVICRRFIQNIFNEGQLSRIREFVSPDSLHHELDGMSAPAGRSPEWFADLVYLYRLAFPDLRLEVEDQIAEGDRVVTCLRMRGTQKGPLLGIGASGQPINVNGIRVDRLDDGKIAESWFHWDGLEMLRQIGALPTLARDPQVAPWAKETAPLPAPMPFPTVQPSAVPPAAEWITAA